MARKLSKKIAEGVSDLQSYPILTSDVGSTGAPTPGATGGRAGGAPIGQIAENAVRDALGWRPKTNDPKNFVAALNQSFALKDVEGHVEWTWMPRTYAVQADMTALTGAQASIYARAKAALDQSLPLLDN